MKFNKKTIALFAVVAMIAIAGCSSADTGSSDAEQLEQDSDTSTSEVGGSYWYEVGVTETNKKTPKKRTQLLSD